MSSTRTPARGARKKDCAFELLYVSNIRLNNNIPCYQSKRHLVKYQKKATLDCTQIVEVTLNLLSGFGGMIVAYQYS